MLNTKIEQCSHENDSLSFKFFDDSSTHELYALYNTLSHMIAMFRLLNKEKSHGIA